MASDENKMIRGGVTFGASGSGRPIDTGEIHRGPLEAEIERLQAEVASLRERAERLTVERDDLQAQTRRMFSAMASIKARRDEDRKKRRAAEERAERAEAEFERATDLLGRALDGEITADDVRDARREIKRRVDAGEIPAFAVCGWCGDPSGPIEAYKAHAQVCSENPAVQRAAAAEAESASLRDEVARLQAERDAACEDSRRDRERVARLVERSASLRSALEGVAECRMIPGDGSYCFCFEFRGRHDDYCEEARAALRSPGTPSGRAE